MKEVFEAAFSAVNIIPTILMILCLLYWGTVIFGVFSMDSLDIDVDVDADVDLDLDVDVDADMDLDTDVDGDFSVDWMNSALSFFNLGKIPLMIILSFFALSLWFISILANHYLFNSLFLISLLLLIPNFIISLFVAKFMTMPFIKIFAKIEGGIDKNISVVGKICSVLLPADSKNFGQAEVKIDGAPLMINIICDDKNELEKGDEALIIDYDETKKYYIVEPYKN